MVPSHRTMSSARPERRGYLKPEDRRSVHSHSQCRLALLEKGRVGGPKKIDFCIGALAPRTGSAARHLSPLGLETETLLAPPRPWLAHAWHYECRSTLKSARIVASQNDFLPLFRSFHGRVGHGGDCHSGLSPGVQLLIRAYRPIPIRVQRHEVPLGKEKRPRTLSHRH